MIKTNQLLGLAGLLLSSALAFALPNQAEVQAQVKAGHYEQAAQEMAEVVAAKPSSAKAHYVYAEILAHQRRFEAAAEHVRLARTLDPVLSFTTLEKFRAFETLLAREQNAAAQPAPARTALASPAVPLSGAMPTATAPTAAGGVPGWAWALGAGALGWGLWRAMRRSLRVPLSTAQALRPSATPYTPAGWGSSTAQPMPNPSYPGGVAAGGMSPGLAAAGGVVGGLAAGMLIDQMLHRGEHDLPPATGHAAATGTGLAGVEPGFFDRELQQDAADQLAQRDIDFGSGNDWDSSGDAGGSSDDW